MGIGVVKVYEFEGLVPVVHSSAYVHPSAVLVGDVIIGANCYVGPAACLRGDFGRLIMEQGSNLQDTCVMHGFPDVDTVIEVDGHIGHGAMLHGCRVGRNALVGISAVVLDGAVIGESSIVGAMAFVREGQKVPPRTLVAGMPARVVRPLSDDEVAWKTHGTAIYRDLAQRSRLGMREAIALTACEPNRKRLQNVEATPLSLLKRATHS